MTDETKQEDENTDATTEESKETQTGTDQKSTAKVFNQDEVNRLIAREKASWKRTSDKATADHETIVNGLRADITARDELIQAQVDLLKKDLELSATEQLLMDKLSDDPLEQFKVLTEMIEAKGKQDAQFPRTPRGKKQEKEFKSNFTPNL